VINVPLRLLISAFLGILILALIYRKRSCVCLLLYPCIFLMGSLNYEIWQQNNLMHPFMEYLPLSDASLEGYIIEPHDTSSYKAIMMLEKLLTDVQQIPVKRKFLLILDRDFPFMLLPGDKIRLHHVLLESLPQPRNPGQLDTRKYLLMHGIPGQITCQPQTVFESVNQSSKLYIGRYLYQIRNAVDQHISCYFDEETAGFLSAIFLGKKEKVNKSVKLDFQKSGVAHVLAISGLHVGFVVYFIFTFLSFLPLSVRWHNVLTLICLIFYMLITGSQPPVVRATVMVSIYLMGHNLERRTDVYNSVMGAAFIILLIQPQQLFWVGFQFSFAAVLSILFFYQKLKPVEKLVIRHIPEVKFVKPLIIKMVQLFLVSLAAQLGTLPLMALYFHQIPIISLILNILVIPMIALIIPVGFLVLLISLFSHSLSILISQLLIFLVQILLGIVHFAAELPGAYFRISAPSMLLIILYGVFLFLIFTVFLPNLRQVRLLSFVCFILLILLYIVPRRPLLSITMLDVGQGDAFLVTTAGDKQLLIDAGPVHSNWDSGANIIIPAIQSSGKLRFDKIFISHPHSDHIGGIFSILSEIKVDSVYLPEMKENDLWQDSALKVLNRKKIPFRLLRMGDRLEIDPFTRIFILSPSIYDDASISKNLNNVSLVMLLQMENSRILWTGDAETPVEGKLLSWGNFLKADILKIGHHGSITSSSEKFLSAVSPSLALISVGKQNKYGHPSNIVLQRLKDSEINYFRSDRTGAVRLEYGRNGWFRTKWN
ncbi:MAG: DNA internalization-related competence protein ComEC/Rec2, partial [Calditrichaeota bacterium]